MSSRAYSSARTWVPSPPAWSSSSAVLSRSRGVQVLGSAALMAVTRPGQAGSEMTMDAVCSPSTAATSLIQSGRRPAVLVASSVAGASTPDSRHHRAAAGVSVGSGPCAAASVTSARTSSPARAARDRCCASSGQYGSRVRWRSTLVARVVQRSSVLAVTTVSARRVRFLWARAGAWAKGAGPAGRRSVSGTSFA